MKNKHSASPFKKFSKTVRAAPNHPAFPGYATILFVRPLVHQTILNRDSSNQQTTIEPFERNKIELEYHPISVYHRYSSRHVLRKHATFRYSRPSQRRKKSNQYQMAYTLLQLAAPLCRATFPSILLNTNCCWMTDNSSGGVRFFGLLRILEKIDDK
jgi:hypothetical protein